MAGKVRKLALDLGLPWLVPLQILTALSTDYFYLFDNQFSGLMTGGVMLALQGTSTYNKIALWRTLPVTQKEIGQARWWQMTGLPGVGIVLVMIAALALHVLAVAIGWTHLPIRADAEGVLLGLLLQFFYPVFLTVFSLATHFARASRSPFAYAAPVAVWAPWLLLLPDFIPLPAQDRFLLLSLVSVATAVILYITAAHWPLPVTQPVQLELGGNHECARIFAPAGRGGWMLLGGMALARVALMLVPIMALYIAVILALNLRHIVPMQMQLFIPFIVISQITRFNGTALRALRALPGSALALAAYLFLLPQGLLAALTVIYSLFLAPWLAGSTPQIDIVALSAVLLTGALALPAALTVSQTVMSLILVASMALVALIQYGWDTLPPPWSDERFLIGMTLLTVGAGFCWMHAQISRGSRVYRLQPYVPARWRGND